jgi:hypothetical protein
VAACGGGSSSSSSGGSGSGSGSAAQSGLREKVDLVRLKKKPKKQSP